MHVARIVAIAVGSVVALLALVLVAAWLFIDPNDYKDRIAQAVKSSTGRELTLTGDIELSLFPWLALQIGPASLGNPPGFGTKPFATLQRAALRVKLMPLLRKQLQVGRVEIDGLDLDLQKNAAARATGKTSARNHSNRRRRTAPRSRSTWKACRSGMRASVTTAWSPRT